MLNVFINMNNGEIIKLNDEFTEEDFTYFYDSFDRSEEFFCWDDKGKNYIIRKDNVSYIETKISLK